jgi:hypothetical protein
MPSGVDVEPVGEFRFFLQPRWAPGPYVPFQDGARRRDFPTFSEIEVELGYDGGSVVAVVNATPFYGSGLLLATCFDDFFQPLRKILYGPADEPFRVRVWNQLQVDRPMFAAAFSNGLHHDLGELMLLQERDPATGDRKNLIASVARGKDRDDLLDDDVVLRLANVVLLSTKLLEEAATPVQIPYPAPGTSSTDAVGTATSAAVWVFDNAGKVKDVIDLVRVFTG